MTDEQLNRRVAELAGWVNISPKFHSTAELCGFHRDFTEGNYMTSIPNYTQSRDAILGLVAGLSLTEQNKIIDQLVGVAHRYQLPDMRAVLTAPARDICMAYVRVMECSRKHEPA